MDGNVIAYDHISNRNEKGWNMLNKLDKNLQGFWNLSVYELLYLLEQKKLISCPFLCPSISIIGKNLPFYIANNLCRGKHIQKVLKRIKWEQK